MKDIEFIEKVRELSKVPTFVKDQKMEQFNSDEVEIIGMFIDHRLLISKLLTQYDQEKFSENNQKAV